MRVLVTGANGFVGRALCRSLLAEGRSVRGAVRRGGAPLPAGVEPVLAGEIGRDTGWAAALRGMEAVVHLAVRVHMMDDTAQNPLALYRAPHRDAMTNPGVSVLMYIFVI
jgi:nucleoside-diphosphate-sugar epimerase